MYTVWVLLTEHFSSSRAVPSSSGTDAATMTAAASVTDGVTTAAARRTYRPVPLRWSLWNTPVMERHRCSLSLHLASLPHRLSRSAAETTWSHFNTLPPRCINTFFARLTHYLPGV